MCQPTSPFAEGKHCMETSLKLDWGLMRGSDMHKNDSMDRRRNRSSEDVLEDIDGCLTSCTSQSLHSDTPLVCSHCNSATMFSWWDSLEGSSFSSINSRTRFVMCVACCGSFEIDIRKELGALIQTIQYWYSGFWASSQLVVCSLDMPMRSHIQFYFFSFFFFWREKGTWAHWFDPAWSNQCNLWANSILSMEVRSKLLAPLKL